MMKWKDLKKNYNNQIETLRAQTPYERLGLEYGAQMDTVKMAYRRKMRLYHPDRTDAFMAEHGEEIAKLLNQAVEQIEMELKR